MKASSQSIVGQNNYQVLVKTIILGKLAVNQVLVKTIISGKLSVNQVLV